MRTITLFSILSFLLIISFSVLGQKTKQGKKVQSGYNVTSQTPDKIIIEFNPGDYILKAIKNDNEIFYRISVSDGTPLLKKGAPDIPVFAKSIIVPDNKGVDFKITDIKYVEIKNRKIIPSQGNIKRGKDKSLPLTFGKEYSEDRFFPTENVKLRKPYIFRDFHGQTIVFQPFRYNPVKSILQVCTSITIELTSKTNKFQTSGEGKNISSYQDIYKKHFLNYKSKKRYEPLNEEGSMLIISAPEFIELLNPFIEWKAQRGITTEVIDASQFEKSEDIKTFVADYYAKNNLAYLLLVGDAEQVPSYYRTGTSDIAYGFINGIDSYPEIFVGRFSGENSEEINTQIKRSITYEKFPQVNGEWYSKAIAVASKEGPGHFGEYDYEHLQNINEDLLNYTYTAIDEMYDGTQEPNDQPGNPTKEMLINSINGGKGLFNYIGHGLYNNFETTEFSGSDVPELINYDQLPFVISVACQIGNFDGKTCLAEHLMRGQNNNRAIGAIAVFGSSIDQDWDPPMTAHDEMIDILTGKYEDNIKHSIGALAINGCMLMNDQYGAMGADNTNTWILFGDPSLYIRTKAPDELKVTHNSAITIGENQFVVNCETNEAIVTLTKGTDIISKGIIKNGRTSLIFEPFSETDNITLTISAYNAIPYIVEIPIDEAPAAYVVLNGFKTSQTQAQRNNEAVTSEKFKLDLELKNVGNVFADTVMLVLKSDDEYVNIIDSTAIINKIELNEELTLKDIFQIEIANNTPDRYEIDFTLEINDNGELMSKSAIEIIVNAPDIFVDFAGINNENGVANGRLDVNETLQLNFEIANNGHFSSEDIACNLKSKSEFIDIIEENFSYSSIDSGASLLVNFNVEIKPECPIGENASFELKVNSGAYSTMLKLNERVGLLIEDWEREHFSSFKWQINEGINWKFVSDEVKNGSFALKTDTIADEDSTKLSIKLDVLSNDSICFDFKTSTEAEYDYFKFYIDGELIEEWSGINDWTNANFDVTPGVHEFSWVFSKDFAMSEGEDCVWIDNIVLPVSNTINFIPEITANPSTIANVDSLYLCKIAVTDNDVGDVIEFFADGLPYWLKLDSIETKSAVVCGTPDFNAIGKSAFTVYINDGTDTVAVEFDLKTVLHNVAPRFISEEILNVKVENQYFYHISTTDEDNDSIKISCLQKPEWLDFIDYGNGDAALVGTPGQNDTLNYEIIISASDKHHITYQKFTISVLSGVNKYDEDLCVKIRPNPTTEKIIITLPDLLDEKEVKVRDFSGRIIELLQVAGGQTIIDLSNYTQGIYFLNFKIRGKIITKKIIKN